MNFFHKPLSYRSELFVIALFGKGKWVPCLILVPLKGSSSYRLRVFFLDTVTTGLLIMEKCINAYV